MDADPVPAAHPDGKTVIAAVDTGGSATSPARISACLFIAHRQEILTQSRWTYRQVLADGVFGELYVGGDRPNRWRHVFAPPSSRCRDVNRMRALGNCVSVEHAKFMAKRFTEAGVPAECVHAATPSDLRAEALKALRDGTVKALFAVDLVLTCPDGDTSEDEAH